jgi:hypothetical protein
MNSRHDSVAGAYPVLKKGENAGKGPAQAFVSLGTARVALPPFLFL